MSRGLLVAGLLLLSGCGALTGFSCLDDSQCRNGGRSGQCETGYCAYPDGTCGSGLRWSTAAADGFADRCVDMTDTTTLGTDSDASTTDATAITDASSTTLEIPMPFCGDGVIDEGEQCDPAIVEPDAPHCNAECQISGQLLSEFTWDGEGGNDAALAVLLWDGDIAVAGHAEWEGQGYDVHVALHAPEGELRWPAHRYSGAALRHDYARALAITYAGTLMAVGYAVPEEGDMDREQIWLAELGVDGTPVWETEVGVTALTDQALAVAIVDATDFIVAGRAGLDSDFAVQRYRVAAGMPSLVWEALVPGIELESDVAYALAVKDNLYFAGGFLWASATDRDRYLSHWLLDGTQTNIPCDIGEHPRPPDGIDEIRGVAVRPDGSIVAVGVGQQGETQDAWVGLYSTGLCALGWQSFEGTLGGNDAFVAVAVDTQGNVITGGWRRDGTNDDTWLVAWTGDTELQFLWEAVENGPGDGDDRINAIAIDGEDGTIVVAGQVSKPTHSDVWVGRYTP